MFQKLVLIIALLAQIFYQFVRSLINVVELVALNLRHTPSRVTSDTPQTVVKLGA